MKLIAGKPEEQKPVEQPTHVWCESGRDGHIDIYASNKNFEGGQAYLIAFIDSEGSLHRCVSLPKQFGMQLDEYGRIRTK